MTNDNQNTSAMASLLAGYQRFKRKSFADAQEYAELQIWAKG